MGGSCRHQTRVIRLLPTAYSSQLSPERRCVHSWFLALLMPSSKEGVSTAWTMLVGCGLRELRGRTCGCSHTGLLRRASTEGAMRTFFLKKIRRRNYHRPPKGQIITRKMKGANKISSAYEKAPTKLLEASLLPSWAIYSE